MAQVTDMSLEFDEFIDVVVACGAVIKIGVQCMIWFVVRDLGAEEEETRRPTSHSSINLHWKDASYTTLIILDIIKYIGTLMLTFAHYSSHNKSTHV